jgi:hypothetical protein
MVVDQADDDQLRRALAAQLDDMTLGDETEPGDEGYMDAVREWLAERPGPRAAG